MTITEYCSLDVWLNYLATRHVEPIQLGLERVRAVARQLDLWRWSVPVITVAGTNGKGSTVAMLESIYHAAGYRVAAYTSPHLLHFNERIRFNQVPIADETLCALFATLHARPESLALTYFEMTTLAALLYFKSLQPHLLVLEVGLGGRLDATNIIDADLAIVTTVDFDHQAFLGNTLEAIGYEKAGIFRPNQTVVYAETKPPLSVLHKAQSLCVTWLGLGTEYTYEVHDTDWVLHLPRAKPVTLPRPGINLSAAAAALVASDYLRQQLPLSVADWAQALRQVALPGRQHLLPNQVNTLLDVAHNPQAVRLLADYLHSQQLSGRIHAVFAALNDKDIVGLIAPMQALVSQWYVVALSGPRAVNGRELGKVLMQRGVSCDNIIYCQEAREAYRTAMQSALPGDWVVVYGSFLTVAPVLAMQPRKSHEICNE